MKRADLKTRFEVFCTVAGFRPAKNETDVGGVYLRYHDNDRDMAIVVVVNKSGGYEAISGFESQKALYEAMGFTMRIIGNRKLSAFKR